ncbi:hypothetical protein Tco_0747058 [Tanacetum coccineum]
MVLRDSLQSLIHVHRLDTWKSEYLGVQLARFRMYDPFQGETLDITLYQSRNAIGFPVSISVAPFVDPARLDILCLIRTILSVVSWINSGQYNLANLSNGSFSLIGKK